MVVEESTDWKFYPLNTIIFLWALQEARDKKIRQRKDPMGEVANPPIWLGIKILHCTRVMLYHSGHMITHDDKTRPSNLVFLPNMGGGGADVCTWVWGGMCLLWDTQGFTMAGPLNIASDNQHQPSSPCDTLKHSLQQSFRFRDPTKNPSEHFSIFITQSCQYWQRKMVLPTTGVTSVQ